MSCKINMAHNWYQLVHRRYYSYCILDTESSALSFRRFHSHRRGYCLRYISTFKSGISHAWNSTVSTRAKHRFLSFTWYFARHYLRWHIWWLFSSRSLYLLLLNLILLAQTLIKMNCLRLSNGNSILISLQMLVLSSSFLHQDTFHLNRLHVFYRK